MNKYSYVKSSISKRREWLDKAFKAGNPCADCKQLYPSFVLDFHHKERENKSFNIGRGIYRHSKEKIVAEIKKCELLCSNCHRVRTHHENVRRAVGITSLS